MAKRIIEICIVLFLFIFMVDSFAKERSHAYSPPQQSIIEIGFLDSIHHYFNGYGANLPPPVSDVYTNIQLNALHDLNMNWVKADFNNPYSNGDLPAPVNVSSNQMYSMVSVAMKNYYQSHPLQLFQYQSLKQNNIKIVMTMYKIPEAYLKNGRINPVYIATFAEFYAAYLRALENLNISADFVEIVNEPNLRGFNADDYATFVKQLVIEMTAQGVKAPLAAPGTSGNKPNLPFMDALIGQDVVPSLSAINVHAYYFQQNAAYGPVADSSGYLKMFKTANSHQIPLLVTEFGGKPEASNRDDEVSPAEEMKAAFDLVRAGGNAALVWVLSPTPTGNKNWELIDANGNPQPIYAYFKQLAENFPLNSAVLAVDPANTNVIPTMTSVGYVALSTESETIIGLSNPSSDDLLINITVGQSNKTKLGYAVRIVNNKLIKIKHKIILNRGHFSISLQHGGVTILHLPK